MGLVGFSVTSRRLHPSLRSGQGPGGSCPVLVRSGNQPRSCHGNPGRSRKMFSKPGLERKWLPRPLPRVLRQCAETWLPGRWATAGRTRASLCHVCRARFLPSRSVLGPRRRGRSPFPPRVLTAKLTFPSEVPWKSNHPSCEHRWAALLFSVSSVSRSCLFCCEPAVQSDPSVMGWRCSVCPERMRALSVLAPNLCRKSQQSRSGKKRSQRGRQ